MEIRDEGRYKRACCGLERKLSMVNETDEGSLSWASKETRERISSSPATRARCSEGG